MLSSILWVICLVMALLCLPEVILQSVISLGSGRCALVSHDGAWEMRISGGVDHEFAQLVRLDHRVFP